MSRIQQPRAAKVPAKPRKTSGSQPDSSGPSSSPSRPSSPRHPSSTDSPPDSDGWQKPSKVARRPPPAVRHGTEELGQGGSGSSPLPPAESGLQALGLIGPGEDPMAPGVPKIEGPKDMVMVDPNQMKLKRARSPLADGKPPSVQPLSMPRSDWGKGPAGRSLETGRQQLSSSGTSNSDPVPRVVGRGKAVTPATERGDGSPRDAVAEAADDQSKGKEGPVVPSADAGRQGEPRKGRPESLGGSLVSCAVGIKEQGSGLVPERGLRSPAPTCLGSCSRAVTKP